MNKNLRVRTDLRNKFPNATLPAAYERIMKETKRASQTSATEPRTLNSTARTF